MPAMSRNKVYQELNYHCRCIVSVMVFFIISFSSFELCLAWRNLAFPILNFNSNLQRSASRFQSDIPLICRSRDGHPGSSSARVRKPLILLSASDDRSELPISAGDVGGVGLGGGSSTEGSRSTSNPIASPILGEFAREKLLTAFMVRFWHAVTFPDRYGDEVNFILEDYGLNRNTVQGFLKHFQTCKDCAADGAFLLAMQNEEKKDMLQLTCVDFQLFNPENDDEEWGMFDRALIGEELDGEAQHRTIFPVEEDDHIILRDTREWVTRVIADFSVCPFTIDDKRAGIPVGGVRYSISRAKSVDEAFLAYWQEMDILLRSPERTMATILLVFPELELFGNYELFESYCESLNDALAASSLDMEKAAQLVFFHPRFQFRDGKARSGDEAGAPNFARRGPWPMVNILRTPQVKAAQKGIPTGVVYQNNERRLEDVGASALEEMLYTRDWSKLPTQLSASKTARKMQEASLPSLRSADLESSLLVQLSSQSDNILPMPYPTVSVLSDDASAVAAAANAAGCPFAASAVAAGSVSGGVLPSTSGEQQQQQQQQEREEEDLEAYREAVVAATAQEIEDIAMQGKNALTSRQQLLLQQQQQQQQHKQQEASTSKEQGHWSPASAANSAVGIQQPVLVASETAGYKIEREKAHEGDLTKGREDVEEQQQQQQQQQQHKQQQQQQAVSEVDSVAYYLQLADEVDEWLRTEAK